MVPAFLFSFFFSLEFFLGLVFVPAASFSPHEVVRAGGWSLGWDGGDKDGELGTWNGGDDGELTGNNGEEGDEGEDLGEDEAIRVRMPSRKTSGWEAREASGE